MLSLSRVGLLVFFAPQLIEVAAAATYLSEKDNWHVVYVLEPHGGCRMGPGSYPVTDLETDVAFMREGMTDCKLFLQVKLIQKAIYDGIFVDSTTQVRGFAIGQRIAEMVFGSSNLFGWAHTKRWWMTLQMESSDKGDCSSASGFFMKQLDSAVATNAAPSIKSNWMPLSYRAPFYRLPVPMSEKGFQIAEFVNTSKSCQQVVDTIHLSFYLNLQEKKNFLQLATKGTVEYYVFPFCVPETPIKECRSGALSVSDVKKCASELHLHDSACPLKIEARIVQDSLHDGIVYDSEGSTTAVVSLRKEFLLNALGVFFDHPVLWNLEQVEFYGYSEKATELCAVGGLMYRSELQSEVASTKNSTDWADWKGLTNGVYIFHFDSYRSNPIINETTDGSYWAYLPPSFSPSSDLEVALKQGQRCDWEQSRTELRATVVSGTQVDYTALQQVWQVTYQVSLLPSDHCEEKFPECTYRGTNRWSLLKTCIDRAKAAHGNCVVRVDVELYQSRGHGGIPYSTSGKTTFGVAISTDVTEKAFTPLLTEWDAAVYLTDIKFNGTATRKECLFSKNHTLIYQNDVLKETPAMFSEWGNTSHIILEGLDLYDAEFDPKTSFSLAVDQSDRDCKIQQQSASLKVTYLY